MIVQDVINVGCLKTDLKNVRIKTFSLHGNSELIYNGNADHIPESLRNAHVASYYGGILEGHFTIEMEIIYKETNMDQKDQLAVEMGTYMLENKATMKTVAEHFNVSISTVFNNLRNKLPKIDSVLAETVDRFIKTGVLPEVKKAEVKPEPTKKEIEKPKAIKTTKIQKPKKLQTDIARNVDFEFYIAEIVKVLEDMKREDFTNPTGMTLKQLATKAGLDVGAINFIAFGRYFNGTKDSNSVLSKLSVTKDSANTWRFIKQ